MNLESHVVQQVVECMELRKKWRGRETDPQCIVGIALEFYKEFLEKMVDNENKK